MRLEIDEMKATLTSKDEKISTLEAALTSCQREKVHLQVWVVFFVRVSVSRDTDMSFGRRICTVSFLVGGTWVRSNCYWSSNWFISNRCSSKPC
jgi:hypothetical protein